MTTTGQGARRRHARITGPAERDAPGTSLTVPRISMSAPAQRSSSTRAARPSTTSVRICTEPPCSAWAERQISSTSSSALGEAGTA